jgi:hypothetical protein
MQEKTVTINVNWDAFNITGTCANLCVHLVPFVQFNDSATVMAANDVKLQAFNLKDGQFAGDGNTFLTPYLIHPTCVCE